MSVFKVQLNNADQGLLDRDPTTGGQFATSKQRTVYIQGPGNIKRTLFDGDTFTDSNYYKRFAYPQVSLADAVLTVLSDDGSVYVDGPNGDSLGSATTLRVYNLAPVINSVVGGDVDDEATGYAAGNVANIFEDTGGYAIFTQITNTGDVTLKVKVNGSTNAIFDLVSGDTQIYNHGDLLIAKIEFGNESGSTVGEVQVQCSVKNLSYT